MIKSISFAALLALGACSSTDLGAGRELGVQGQKVGEGLKLIHGETARELRGFRAEIFLLSRIPPQRSALDKDEEQALAQIESLTAARSAVGGAMAKAYGAFAALASYDARGEMRSALNELGGAINHLGSVLNRGGKSPVSAVAQEIVSTIGAGIIEEVQKSRMRAASVQLRGHVTVLKQLLERQSSRDLLVGLRTTMASQRIRVQEALWRSGAFSARPAVSRFADGYLIEPMPQAVRFTPANARIGPVVTGALAWATQERHGELQSAYEGLVQSLGDLISAHADFEAGKAVDLSVVRQRLGELQAFLERLNAAKAKDAASR